MTDKARDDEVRRLLGRLGSEPSELPPDVAARLHQTLRELVEERRSEEPSTTPLPEVRSRRRPQLLLAAAAAVVVVALGGATVMALTRSGTVTADSAGSTAQKAPAAPSASIPMGTADDSGAGESMTSADLPVLRPDTFGADVSRLLRRSPHPPGTRTQGGVPAPAADCTPPQGATKADVRPVLYGDALALLVVRPPRHGAALAEAWTCSGENRLASARIRQRPDQR